MGFSQLLEISDFTARTHKPPWTLGAAESDSARKIMPMDVPGTFGDVPGFVGRQFYVSFDVNSTQRHFHENQIFGEEIHEIRVFQSQLGGVRDVDNVAGLRTHGLTTCLSAKSFSSTVVYPLLYVSFRKSHGRTPPACEASRRSDTTSPPAELHARRYCNINRP